MRLCLAVGSPQPYILCVAVELLVIFPATQQHFPSLPTPYRRSFNAVFYHRSILNTSTQPLPNRVYISAPHTHHDVAKPTARFFCSGTSV